MELVLRVLKWSALAGVLTALVLALRGPLDRRYRAKWRYWLWLALAAVLALAPLPWGELLPERVQALEPPVVVRVPQTTIVVGVEGVSLAPREDLTPAVPAAPAELAEPAADRETGRPLPLDAVLTALWLIGAAALLAWRLAGSWAFSRKVRRWSRPAPAETLALCDQVRQDMGIKRMVPMAVCAAVDSPMAVGVLQPRLLLPRGDYGEEELTFILRHELTHIRRRDLWYKLVLLLAQTVHWFNPLVWLMVRQAEADIELTCDDAVMAGRDGGDRRAYSEALLKSLHRQKGLAKAALSTHFYGGAEVMKERFRNILSSGKRRWGGVALAVALTAVAVAGCAVGVSAAAEEPLSDEELAAWQETLQDPAYNGFLAAMYSDVSRLPVAQVFYNGAGVNHEMTEAERAAVVEAMGGDPDCAIYAVTTQAADGFLREHTGLGLDGIAGGFGSGWLYLPEYDSYYFAHGDTNVVNCAVTGGVRRGDTVELTIELPGGNLTWLDAGVLTVVDGKIKSFTTPLYTAVETMAWQVMNDQAETYESAEDGPAFVDRYISGLWCGDSFTIDGTTYSVWNVGYRLLPEDLSKVVLTGDMDLENGWLTEAASMGSPVLIVSVDEDGNITLEEQTWAYALWRDDGFTWEEYIYCRLHLGMELTYKLGGWPELTTPFITDLLEGHNTWSQSWDSCAVAYLEELGVAPGPLTQVQEFAQPADGDCDESLLVRCDSGGDTLYLLLCHIVYPVESWNATAAFWMVCGEVWEGGSTQPTGRQEHALYRTEVDLGGGHTGTLYLTGWQGNDCGGVSSVQVVWDGGGGTLFFTRDAIAAQWGEDSRDYFTEGSSYVENENGYHDFDGGLRLLDVNFDGCLDIGLQAWRDGDSGSWYEYFWLFDPETRRFRYAFCLREVGTDPETGEVVSAYTEDGVSYEDRYAWDGAGNLTLRRRVETGANGETAVYTAAEGIPLTAGELADFSQLFTDDHLYNGLLNFPFAGPEDAGYYLDLLFYDIGNWTESGEPVEETISEEEREALRAVWPSVDNYDVQKVTRARAQALLARAFGLTEAEAAELLTEAAVKPGPLYLEEYDAYYAMHTDTEWEAYTFTGGFFYADGTCVLDYETDYIADFSKKPPEERGYWSSAAMRVTLRQEDGGWVAVSNLGRSE